MSLESKYKLSILNSVSSSSNNSLLLKHSVLPTTLFNSKPLENSLLSKTANASTSLKLTNFNEDARKKKAELLEEKLLEIKKPKIESNSSSLISQINLNPKLSNNIVDDSVKLSVFGKNVDLNSKILKFNNKFNFSIPTFNQKTSNLVLKVESSLLNTAVQSKFKAEKIVLGEPSNKRTFNQLSPQISFENNSDYLKAEYLLTENLIREIETEYQASDISYRNRKKLRKNENKLNFSDHNLISFKETEIKNLKNILINTVSSSLLRQPNFKNINDQTRKSIFDMSLSVINYDPEFILKLALYTRQELNIRETANFLICIASFKEECRIYLHRYFNKSIVLPSDWISVAEQYQLFMNGKKNYASLPSALRKCMIEKFSQFDQYQLAKYNKEKSRMAKNKNLKDVKKFKARIKGTEENVSIVEKRFVKTIKNGLKINDRIYFEMNLGENCKNFKIDILSHDESLNLSNNKLQPSKTRRGIVLAKKKISEQDEKIAIRINIDLNRKQITQKSFINKAWTKKVYYIYFPPNFNLEKNLNDRFKFYIDVKASEFVFSVLENDSNLLEISKYKHSKHNIELYKLNNLRFGGVAINLKDLTIKSGDIINFDSQNSNENDIKQQNYTIKQLIRKLHINKPVDSVMSLLGKKYPLSFEEFMQSKLPGVFESEKAGKRMKLPTPETWETQVSMKGNKASVWEQLIDNKKLPYMAMLRNLRNMIKCGISNKHHDWVLKKLCDEGAVIHSRQFPFRFFTAYEILDELQQEMIDYLKWCDSLDNNSETILASKKKDDKKNTKRFRDMFYDEGLLKRYKIALDNALKVATTYNISPIKGNTCILLNMGSKMNFYISNNPNAKSLGKKVGTIADLAALLALMFKYSCEYSKLIVFSNNLVYIDVELEQGTILENMKSLTNLEAMKARSSQMLTGDMRSSLNDILANYDYYDNLIFLSNGIEHVTYYQEFLRKYRAYVNENLLFVNVNLSLSDCNIINDTNFTHEMDVSISGFSDSILRFVAERGNQGQLIHIENIDKSYELPDLKKIVNNNDLRSNTEITNYKIERPLSKLSIPLSQWKTVKVFISSTFLDMHAERDILTKTIFPMLRSKLSSRLINVYEVDLRWGISDEMYKDTLDICLNQVLESDYFISILGERYGNTLNSYDVAKNKQLEWLNKHPPNASITELEIECQLNKIRFQSDRYERTFFYFRDSDILNKIPDEFKYMFITEDPNEKLRLEELKKNLKLTSYEIYDGYKCDWYKMEGTRALLTNLDQFAYRVFNNLFNSIKNHFENTVNVEINESIHLTSLNDAFLKLCADNFVGRNKLTMDFKQLVENNKLVEVKEYTTDLSKELAKKTNDRSNIVLIHGDMGCGKSTFVANFFNEYKNDFFTFSFTHFVGSYDGSEYTKNFLKRFCQYTSIVYNLFSDELKQNELSESDDVNFFRQSFFLILDKLNEIVKLTNQKFFILIDGVDNFLDENNNRDDSFSWLPTKLPFNISFIFSAQKTSKYDMILNKLISNADKIKTSLVKLDLFEIQNLNVLDKAEIIRLKLDKHNKYLDESPFSNQMKLLTNKRDSTNPFYLSLLCEELKLHNQYETLNNKLKELPAKVNLLVEYILERLEMDFGAKFVKTAFTFICCAKDGITELELNDLLTIDSFVDNINFYEQLEKATSLFKIISQHKFKSLYNLSIEKYKVSTHKFLSFIDSIKEFLKPRSSNGLMIVKSIDCIVDGLKNRYGEKYNLKLDKLFSFNSSMAHKIMSIYYWKILDKNFEAKFDYTDNQRALIYLPYHLSLSNLHTDLIDLLCDLRFLSIKCQHKLISQLMEDFDLHQDYKFKNILNNYKISKSKQISESCLNSKRFTDYKYFISTNYHLLIENHQLLYQLAFNQPESSFPYQDLTNLLRQNDNKFDGEFLFEYLSKPNIKSENAKILPTKINEFNGTVSSVSISPNGELVACGTEFCEIKIFSVTTANLIRTFHGHSGRINQLCFTSNGNILCSASSDGLASLWDLKDGFRIKILNKHNEHVVSGCSAEPNNGGKLLITVGWDCSAKIWNSNDGTFQGELKGHPRPINCITYSTNNDNLIATGCWDSAIRIYNLVDRSRKAVLRGHKTSIRSISYSMDSTYLASSSLDGQVKLWNSKTGNQLTSLSVNKKAVNSIFYSPNSQFLLTGSNDRTVKCWSGSIGKCVQIINEVTNKKIIPTCVCFNQKNGDSFCVGYNNGDLKLFNTIDGSLKASVNEAHNACIRKIKFSHHGFHILTAAENGSVKLFDARFLPKISQALELTGNHSAVNALAISCDNIIITGSDECILNVYTNVINNLTAKNDDDEIEMNSLFDGLNFESNLNKNITATNGKLLPNFSLSSHKSPITGLSFSKNGEKFVSSSKDATIIIWKVNIIDYSTKMCEIDELQKIEYAHNDWITDIEWSNSSDFFLTSSNDFSMKIFNANDGKEKSVLLGHTAMINSCSFQYGCAVSACSDGTIKIWSHKGHEITTLRGHQNRINSCDMFVKLKNHKENDDIKESGEKQEEKVESWAEKVDQNEWIEKNKKHKENQTFDHVYLVTVSDDSTIRLWKPIESDYLISLENHKCKINSICLSKDGILASASSDKSINLYNLKSYFSKIQQGNISSLEYESICHNSEITSLCVNENLGILLSGSQDGKIFIWKIDYNDRKTIDGIKFLYEMKAHESACNNICLLDIMTNNSIKLSFLTCSNDKYIKLWSFNIDEITNRPQIELIQTLVGENILFLEKIEDTNYFLTVEYQSLAELDILLIKFFSREKNKSKKLILDPKLTFRLGAKSLISNSIKLLDKYLYITLMRKEIIKLDIKNILSKSKPFFMNIDITSESDSIKIIKYNEQEHVDNDTYWFTSIDKNIENEKIIGTSKGKLVKLNEIDELIDVKTIIPSSPITELTVFKTKFNENRIALASDCFFSIWSENGEFELGRFYLNNLITKIKLISQENDRFVFVLGDQSGHVNLVRWYDEKKI